MVFEPLPIFSDLNRLMLEYLNISALERFFFLVDLVKLFLLIVLVKQENIRIF